ncbi:hypothetical protein HHX47_DHR2001152 [Lentinula edodes]|nr:hypothetical protein HHX47_DHR2001152 [Lentinula edodes]
MLEHTEPRTVFHSSRTDLKKTGIKMYRYVVHEYTLPNGSVWKLRAIFDGHMGYDTVNHVAEHLSTKVQDRLNNAFPKLDPDSVSSLLAEVITTVDDSLLVDLLSGIPSESQLSSLTEYEVQNILGGDHRSKVLRSMQGTTVIIALTNPDNEDLWVASLGDSYADVKYVDLKSKRLGDSPSRLNTDKKGNDIVLRMCLLMCTDGLVDLYEDELETKEPLDIFQRCMDVACAVPTARYCKTSTTDHCDNVALSILRDALGGTDIEKVSTMMTVEMQDKWMDDTTILFEFL